MNKNRETLRTSTTFHTSPYHLQHQDHDLVKLPYPQVLVSGCQKSDIFQAHGT